MALLQGLRAPRCFSCLCNSLDTDIPSLLGPIKIQVRGKKRLPRRTTITIRLLENVKAYGAKGSILAIAPARMRNHLYPRSQATYMTVAEVRKAEADELVMERDASYGLVQQVKAKKDPKVTYDMKLISPPRARELLEQIIPETIEFERTPILQDNSTELGAFIFGSVSSLDILTDINAQLAKRAVETGFEDASQVVLSAQDIQINVENLAPSLAEPEKIKSIGEFDITINMKTTEPLKRKVKVIPLKGES